MYLYTYLIPILLGSALYHLNHPLGEATTTILTILLLATYKKTSTHKKNTKL